MELSELAQDIDLEEEGVEVDLPCGATVKVARLNNSKARVRTERLMARFRHLERAGKPIPGKEQRRILVEVIAHDVLKGWSLAEDGKPVPYTPERAIEILSDEKFRDFFDEVREAAQYRETFVRQEVEAAEKNSGRPPAGSSSGGHSLKSSEG